MSRKPEFDRLVMAPGDRFVELEEGLELEVVKLAGGDVEVTVPVGVASFEINMTREIAAKFIQTIGEVIGDVELP